MGQLQIYVKANSLRHVLMFRGLTSTNLILLYYTFYIIANIAINAIFLNIQFQCTLFQGKRFTRISFTQSNFTQIGAPFYPLLFLISLSIHVLVKQSNTISNQLLTTNLKPSASWFHIWLFLRIICYYHFSLFHNLGFLFLLFFFTFQFRFKPICRIYFNPSSSS